MAKENKQPEQNEALRGILDPIAPEDLTEHWQSISGWLDPMRDLNPEYLANMDYNKQISGGNQSFNQYWDDSSPEMQWTLGWTNQKYTWEYTKNSDINYDANITTKDLNPNFVYWKASQVYGTDHPWYISQRNDQIASALFNEWRVTKDEVRQFLEGQNWFWNSSEADRANTVESVWKRLWQLSEQNKPEEEWPDLSKAEEIQKDYSWEIYWKTTAEEWTPKEWIDTLADKNSVYAAMEAWRVANLKALVSMKPRDIAVAELNWIMPQWEQANRDLQQYYPEIYAQVQEEKKKIVWQQNVNAIASGWEMTSATDNAQSTINNEKVDFANKNATSTTSSAEIEKNINTMLDSNGTAQSAEELMWTIEWEMATLKNRLKNLKNEANAAFKWDVPDYLVKAYINNKTQEIQNQLSILEDRYNAAYSRYKTELANTQWEKEFQLKQDELALKKESFKVEKWATEQWIAIDWYKAKWAWTSVSNSWRELPVTTKSREEIWWIIDGLLNDIFNWKVWNAQCAAWIQKYYFPKLWISIWWLSTLEAKKWLINTWQYYTPQKWDLIIINSWAKLKDWTPAGHIWIVIGMNGDQVKYIDWNWASDEKPAVRTMSINSKSIEWYYDVTKWQQSASEWTYKFTDAEIARFERYLNNELEKHEVDDLKETYWVDAKWLNAIANYAVYWDQEDDTWYSWDSNDIDYSDLDSIEVPDSVYTIDIWERADWSKITRKVDPNSEEWKKLAQQYRQSVAQQGWYNAWTSTSSTTTPSSNQSTNLWFDVNMRNDFEAIYNWSKSVADIAKWRGMSQKKVQQMYDNYLKAKENGYKAYWDSWRNVDPELWFDPDSEALYKEIIKLNFRVPWTQQKQILSTFWIDSTDPDAWKQVKEEAMNYHKWAKYNLVDPQVQEMARAVEYLIAQDATSWQRWLWWGYLTSVWEMKTWNSYWNFIKNNLTLNHFEEIKKNWLTFWNLTEWELKVIWNASDALVSGWRNMDSDSFRTEVNRLYNAIRETLWYNKLSNEELNKMWNIEDASNNSDWSNFLMLDHSHKTWLFWWYNYRRYQWKDYKEWTAWYNKYWPKSTTPWAQQSTSQSSWQWKSAQDKTDDMFTFW